MKSNAMIPEAKLLLAMAALMMSAPVSAQRVAFGLNGQKELTQILETMTFKTIEIPAVAGMDGVDPRHFTIDEDSIVIERVGPASLSILEESGITLPVEPGPGIGLTDDGDDSSGIINIAKKVWAVIKENKPVLKAATFFAAAVPAGVSDWRELAGWSKPEATLYRFQAKNGFGMSAVDVTYVVMRTSNGNFKGKGRYLTGVTIAPVNVDVLWGFNVSMDVAVPTVNNVGSVEDPIAAMTLSMTWNIETPIKVARGTGLYYLQGDGFFKQIANPFMKLDTAGSLTTSGR